MSGLEVSEIYYSQIHQENRCDSEFYQKSYVDNEAHLRRKPFAKMGDQFFVTDGEHGSVVEQSSGIKYLTAENIKNGYVDIANVRYVNNEVDRKNARARVAVGDVLISIKGTLGAIGVAEEWLLPANMNRDVAILKPLHNKELSIVTALFLMSQYGIMQSSRGGSGGVQQMITLERLRGFINPIFSSQFCLSLNKLFQKTQTLKKQSHSLYSQAENLLLNTLVMADFASYTEAINIKSFKESFAATGRLDAEYYQLKYAAWAERIKGHTAGFDELATACQIKEENFSPDDEQTYRYIELSDIGSHGNITGATEDIGAALPTRARRRVAAGDVVVSSIEGSLQSVALVTDDYDNALCSTGFYVVRSDTINSETLLVLFKSEAYQNLFKQACTGTILTAMPKEFFGRTPVPVIDEAVQLGIAEKVQASFSARLQSQQLLELAKQTVERAIESSEAEALDWLKVQMRQVI